VRYRQPLPPARFWRGPVPRRWLFTDERMPGDAIAAVRALPPRSGIVFRHYATPAAGRARLLRRIARIAVARGHWLLVGGADHRSFAYAAPHDRGAVSAGVHNVREAEQARRAGLALIFVSPVFATRSHPGAAPIGVSGFAQVARTSTGMAIALGGMDARRFRLLRRHGAHGWGAIDALTVTKRERKRG